MISFHANCVDAQNCNRSNLSTFKTVSSVCIANFSWGISLLIFFGYESPASTAFPLVFLCTTFILINETTLFSSDTERHFVLLFDFQAREGLLPSQRVTGSLSCCFSIDLIMRRKHHEKIATKRATRVSLKRKTQEIFPLLLHNILSSTLYSWRELLENQYFYSVFIVSSFHEKMRCERNKTKIQASVIIPLN